MPTSQTPAPAPTQQQLSQHRAQVRLVMASLRAGVRYERPGRVAKAATPRR